MVKLIENKRKRGGARPGSGAKKGLEGGRFRPTYLDDPTVQTMQGLGDGELSRGIRIAAIMTSLLTSHDFEYLHATAKDIEDRSIRERKESQKRKEEE